MLRELQAELGPVEGGYAEYVRALLRAMMNPEDGRADEEARRLELRLPLRANAIWQSGNLLGPPAFQFVSERGWKAFRKGIADGEAMKWLGQCAASKDVTGVASKFIAWGFHPDDWQYLVGAGALRDNEAREMLASPLGRLLADTSNPIKMWEIWNPLPEAVMMPLLELVKAGLSIAEAHGTSRLGEIDWVTAQDFTMRPLEPSEASEVLSRALAVSPLPGLWVAAVMRVCMEASSGIGTEAMIEFWEKNEKNRPNMVWWGSRAAGGETRRRLVEELISGKREWLEVGCCDSGYGRASAVTSDVEEVSR
jgi:hypothetical protein